MVANGAAAAKVAMAKRTGGAGSSPPRGVSGVSGVSVRGSSSSSGTARAGATAVAKATRGSGVGAAVASGAGGRFGRGLAADAAAAVAGVAVKTPPTSTPRAAASGGSREGLRGGDEEGIIIAAVAGELERRIERFWQGDVGHSPVAMLAKVAHGMAARRGLKPDGLVSSGGAKVPAGVVVSPVRGTEGVSTGPIAGLPPPPCPQANGAALVDVSDDCGSDVSVGWASTMTNDSGVNSPVVVVASDSEGDDYSSCYSGVTVDDDDEDDEDEADEVDEEEEAQFERAKARLHARLRASLAQAKIVERQVAALEVKNYELRTLLHVHAEAVAKQDHKTGRVHSPTAAL